MIFDILALIKTPSKNPRGFSFPVLLIYAMLALVFFAFTLSMVLQSIPEISRNETTYEQMRRRRHHIRNHIPKTTTIEAWEDICGSRDNWILWLLPIPAFHGIDEYVLINQRVPSNSSKML